MVAEGYLLPLLTADPGTWVLGLFGYKTYFNGFFVPILYYTGTLVCSTVLLHHPRADKNTPK